jgi:shikimate dehydrogenase
MGQDDDGGPPVFAPGTFSKTTVLYDLVYSPPITTLMREAAEAGCRTFNGLGMLARQGALSLGLWTGLERDALPIAAMEAVLTSP